MAGLYKHVHAYAEQGRVSTLFERAGLEGDRGAYKFAVRGNLPVRPLVQPAYAGLGGQNYRVARVEVVRGLQPQGGGEGVRDLGAIEAALFRPQSGYYSDIIEEAAALMESLLINHPFVDGNKRIGTYVMMVLLELNHIEVEFTDDDIIRIGLELADGEMSEKQLLDIILERSK